MNRADSPKKQAVPFGINGQREDILDTTPAGDNSASYSAGYPAITMTLKAAGGLPPKGQNMNQILFELANVARWSAAGAGYSFDSAFSTTVGGYPSGAKVLSSDGLGVWLNTTDANTANPEVATGLLTGWVPSVFYGSTSITGLSSANVTLTSLQAARDRIELSGSLTSNINIIMPAWRKEWTVINNCTGSFSVTVKTSSGTGVSIATGKRATVYGDATNITDQGYLLASNNLSEISSAGSAAQALTRGNIGLGTAAVANVGSGVNQIPDMTLFAMTNATNAFTQSLPTGVIFQIGVFAIGSAAGATTTVTFPKAFSQICIGLIPAVASAADQMIGYSNVTTTGATIRKGSGDASSRSGFYLAIGI